MKERKWLVYCHVNNVNGKKYVGITSKRPNDRWKNGYGYSRKFYFGRAIHKYGWGNFTHYILAYNLTEQVAKQMEKDFIFEWNLKNRLFGYNGTDGGDGACGYHPTPERLQEMSEKMRGANNPNYGKKRSAEFCIAVSKGKKGVKFSKEHIEHLRISHLGKKPSDEQRRKIKESSPLKVRVICLETGMIFDSISDVSIYYGVDARHVSECCLGTRKTWNSLHWKRYKDYLEEGGLDDCKKT